MIDKSKAINMKFSQDLLHHQTKTNFGLALSAINVQSLQKLSLCFVHFDSVCHMLNLMSGKNPTKQT